MAKFVYKMQNILNIKLKLENQAKIAYGQANQVYQEEQMKLQQLVLKRVNYEGVLESLLEGTINVPKIKHAREDVNTLKTLCRRQMMEVRKAELALEDARKALEEIMKERKTQEILKEKAFEEFKKELLKQESKEIDELVSYTYNPN